MFGSFWGLLTSISYWLQSKQAEPSKGGHQLLHINVLWSCGVGALFPLITSFRCGFYLYCLPAAVTLLLHAVNGGNWQELTPSDHRSSADPSLGRNVSCVVTPSCEPFWTKPLRLRRCKFRIEEPNEKIRPFLIWPLMLFNFLLLMRVFTLCSACGARPGWSKEASVIISSRGWPH